MNYWIFQSDPKVFKWVRRFLKNPPEDAGFAINQHTKEIKEGDVVYYWISGEDSGIHGKGRILSNPHSSFGHWVSEYSELMVEVSVDEYYGNHYLPFWKIKESPVLSDMEKILKKQGTNFYLYSEEAEEIERLLEVRHER